MRIFQYLVIWCVAFFSSYAYFKPEESCILVDKQKVYQEKNANISVATDKHLPQDIGSAGEKLPSRTIAGVPSNKEFDRQTKVLETLTPSVVAEYISNYSRSAYDKIYNSMKEASDADIARNAEFVKQNFDDSKYFVGEATVDVLGESVNYVFSYMFDVGSELLQRGIVEGVTYRIEIYAPDNGFGHSGQIHEKNNLKTMFEVHAGREVYSTARLDIPFNDGFESSLDFFNLNTLKWEKMGSIKWRALSEADFKTYKFPEYK